MVEKSAEDTMDISIGIKMRENIALLSTQTEQCAHLFALAEGGFDSTIKANIKAQEETHRQACSYTLNSILIAASLNLCRVLDQAGDKISLQRVMNELADVKVRQATGGAEAAEHHFQEAIKEWRELETMMTPESLGLVLQEVNQQSKETGVVMRQLRNKHSLRSVLKAYRDHVLVHNIPDKVDTPNQLTFPHILLLLRKCIRLVNHLRLAVGVTEEPISQGLWNEQGRMFWERLARSKGG